jgi:uncharacterized repeat protein (TIGR03987 family)
MPALLIVATALMTLALVLYTVGVWAERLRRYLLKWHVIMFWCGLVCDAAGTLAMRGLSGSIAPDAFHTGTGAAAFALMAGHAAWATVVVVRNDERARATFHRLSVFVWLAWLVPYIGGLVIGMAGS